MNSPIEQPNDSRGLALSALCDGEAPPDQAQQCAEQWRTDAGLRAQWHQFHWIGDVMRSDDLASEPTHDEAFLQALRARLSVEPVVLAPVPVPPVVPRGVTARDPLARRWGSPVAMAAGVMAVAGALVVIRGTTGLSDPGLGPVAGDPGGQVVKVLNRVSEPAAPASAPALGDMLRNPELDRYLAAHRQFAQSPALATPGALRQAVATPDGR